MGYTDRNNIYPADLLTVTEAAELLRVSRVSVHRWIERDKLTAIRIGSSRFVLKSEVEEICRAQDGADLEARLRNILARRTPGWTLSFVGNPVDQGPNTMVAIGPNGERIAFRFEILQQSDTGGQEEAPRHM